MHIRLACQKTKVQDDIWRTHIRSWSTMQVCAVRVSLLYLTDTLANTLLSGVVVTFTRYLSPDFRHANRSLIKYLAIDSIY
jgi:hypothetical protein